MGAQPSSDSQQVADENELISVTLHPASREPGYEDIIAAALSAAFDEKVVTKQEYERRKDEPGFGNAEKLDLRSYEKKCYEPVKVQYGDVFGENGDPIAVTVIVKKLSEQLQTFMLSIGDKCYVKQLKFLFERELGIPVDHNRLIFTFKEKQLEDGCRISDYGITENSEIWMSLMPYSNSSAGCVLVLEPNLLSPESDYDYEVTGQTDDDTFDEREGQPRSKDSQPHRWYRYALNVKDKYGDNAWLGGVNTYARAQSTHVAEEWPVSFHGTEKDKVSKFLQGYLLSKSKSVYGRGIYSSPSIEVAELYAKEFSYDSNKYEVVLQNRVNSNGVISEHAHDIHSDRQHSDAKDAYWLQTREDYIRPYGICIKKC